MSAFRPAQHLVTLVQQARNAEGDERVRWATLVNEALAARAGECGETLVEFLDDGAFDGLVDEEGLSCRRRAVEAVLRLGWPWAMHVAPADLDSLRERPRLSVGAAVAIGVVAGALLFAWYIGA